MKKNKFMLVGVVAAMAILFTGCSAKESKLTCTQTASGVDIEFIVDFKGNIIDAMNFSYDMDVSEYSDLQIEAIQETDFCTNIKNLMTDYKDAFSSCKQDIVDKHLRVESSLDIDKIATSIMGKMTTPEKGKEALEESGYTCTIAR